MPGARLTGGEAAGRHLLTLPDPGLRATTGLVRAALGNILGERLGSARVVDLFAGAGSLGLEALSRGAAWATFVELQRAHAAVIQANLEMLGFQARGEVVVADALAWVRHLEPALRAADVLVMDPPYRDRGPELCQAVLAQLGVAAEQLSEWDPVVVVEHHRQLTLPTTPGALNCVRTARYGTTELSFYQRST
ncbi:MAG TPA: 16S rRNA (guanine(966)-N(2))-methyltransferase RsmD [Candidatus Nanopelagicaceae bacterium]|nr:16S rRNA (guanine(966)-N(2))-methyltransferase RsmD [Candidatus Nanopelagicaceae bacterium]